MSVEVPSLDPWVARLRANTSVRTWSGAADLASAKRDARINAAQGYMLYGEERPSASGDEQPIGRIHQTNHVLVAIVLALPNSRREGLGSAQSEDLRVARQEVRTALMPIGGWIPPGMELEVQFAGGKLWEYNDAVLWWIDRYRSAYTLDTLS